MSPAPPPPPPGPPTPGSFQAKTWAPPPPRRPGLSIDEGLKFFFEDPRWKSKLAMLTLFTLLGCLLVGMPIAAGYLFRITKRTAAGEPPLPEWEDYGGLFMDGLRLVALPFVAMWPFAAGVILLGIVDTLVNGGEDPRSVLGGLLRLVFLLLVLGSVLLAAAYMPSVRIRLALTDRLGAALEWRENLGLIRRNLESYAMSYVLFLLANLISNLGYLACCVGIVPASLWAVAVMSWGEGRVGALETASRGGR
jgi:hypothetical protein